MSINRIQLSAEWLEFKKRRILWIQCLCFFIYWAFPSACTDIKGVSHHDTPFARTRHRDDIYLDCHLFVEIHLHDKICRLWTQRERWRYILSAGPLICPQQASEIKSSLYIIHSSEAALRQSHRRDGGGGTGPERGEGEQERRVEQEKN